MVCVQRVSHPLALQQYSRKALKWLFVCEVVMAGLCLSDPGGVGVSCSGETPGFDGPQHDQRKYHAGCWHGAAGQNVGGSVGSVDRFYDTGFRDKGLESSAVIRLKLST